MNIIFNVSTYPEVMLSADPTDLNHKTQCNFTTYGGFLNAASRSIHQGELFL
jgi:hypothetical protein